MCWKPQSLIEANIIWARTSTVNEPQAVYCCMFNQE